MYNSVFIIQIRPMVAGLLGKSAKDDAETRLLGESAIIDGPNVRDLPSPQEPRVSITPPTVEKHPAPPKQPDRKKLSVSKPISPKSMPLKPVPTRSLSMKINLSLKGVETDAMSESEVKVDGQGHMPIEPEVRLSRNIEFSFLKCRDFSIICGLRNGYEYLSVCPVQYVLHL